MPGVRSEAQSRAWRTTLTIQRRERERARAAHESAAPHIDGYAPIGRHDYQETAGMLADLFLRDPKWD